MKVYQLPVHSQSVSCFLDRLPLLLEQSWVYRARSRVSHQTLAWLQCYGKPARGTSKWWFFKHDSRQGKVQVPVNLELECAQYSLDYFQYIAYLDYCLHHPLPRTVQIACLGEVFTDLRSFSLHEYLLSYRSSEESAPTALREICTSMSHENLVSTSTCYLLYRSSEIATVYLVYCFHLMLSLLLASMESHYFTAYRMDWP